MLHHQQHHQQSYIMAAVAVAEEPAVAKAVEDTDNRVEITEAVAVVHMDPLQDHRILLVRVDI